MATVKTSLKTRSSSSALKTVLIVSFLLALPLLVESFSANPLNVIFQKRDIFGRLIQSNNHRLLLLFFSLENFSHRQSVFYAQSLRTKFHSDQLEIIGVGKDTYSVDDLKSFYERSGLTFHLIRDQANAIHKVFDVKDCCGGVVFMDRGQIKHAFHNMLSPDNLRQLIEKEILGKIDYTQTRALQELFIVNHPVPSFELFYSNAAQPISLAGFNENFIVVTFFSSLCSMCNTGKRVKSLISLKETQEVETSKAKLILVLMSPLNDRDFAEWRKAMALPFDVYYSKYLFSDSMRYVTDPEAQKDPLTIVLDNRKNVIFCEDDRVTENEFITRIKQVLLRKIR